MTRCKHCHKVIWVWPTGVWTHRRTDSQMCYPGPGGDYSKIATPR